jgi:hypothetical protein
MNTQDDCWQALQEQGLVSGLPPAAQAADVPWYVRLVLGLAGWIAALFLLAFVATGLRWIISSELIAALSGTLLMCSAWLLLSRFGRNDFAVQFALAISFAGQVLFAVGVFGRFGLERDATAAWTIMTATQTLLALLMPNSTHRLWSAMAASVAFYMAMYSLQLSFLAPSIILALAAFAWLNEFTWALSGRAVRPAAFGLVLALVAMDLATGVFQPLTGIGVSLLPQDLTTPWISQLLPGCVLLAVAWTLLRREHLAIPGQAANAALLACLLLALAALKAPGLSTGVCIILLGFAHGNRVLTGLGVAALLLYASAFYYQLGDTLLVKSAALAASGAALLALRWLLLRWLRHVGRAAHD